MQLYYADDFSLGEIADEFDVSRQAVYDNIRRTEKILEEYETKLHLLEAYQARNHQADRIQQYVRKNYQDDAELNELVNNLETLEE